jgi:di/tricarboxylate transporter
MLAGQIEIFAILGGTVALFLWGRWRHDVVALASLLACVLAGLVPANGAFAGFGHPAVITVAAVLVLSRGLQSTGAVDALAQRVIPSNAGLVVSLLALAGMAALLSAFINNVGAMALLMPLALQIAKAQDLPPGKILMPLAFATILGGMTTLIGTPPNLIVSGFRAQAGAGSFGMFDFSSVGLAMAATGVLFVALIGWRLVPARKEAAGQGFDTGKYLTEVRVTENGKSEGKTLGELEQGLAEADAQVVGMSRGNFRVYSPDASRVLTAGDILVIEADPESLAKVLTGLGLELEESKPDKTKEEKKSAPEKKEENDENGKRAGIREIILQELVVMPNSGLIGRTATDVRLRTRYGLSLLAYAREGRRSIQRLRTTPMRAGDVLLMQGSQDSLSGFAAEFGCVPLASRSIRVPDKYLATVASLIMALAIAGAAFGLLPAAISFSAAVLLFMALRVVAPRDAYEAVDWSVIVLLGAMIPVAGAMGSTGAADLIARQLLDHVAQGHAVAALVIVLIVTMTLSDFMNNAATAAVMCPIAISTAAQLGVNADAFLMAVAIGASCAFLTPIGHQNNTLILGPGGFQFGDYWKLGLPMEILVLVVGVPMLLAVWPL